MPPWIQVYSNLSTHPKVCRLRDALGLKNNYEAVGLVVCLWLWAAVNASTGSLNGYADRDIADACGWRKPPKKLVCALADVGFLDRGEEGVLTIHDWDEHAALLQASLDRQKEKTAERVRRHRERKRKEAQQPGTETPAPPASNGDGNVTVTPSNGPTIPNHTKPNLTNYVGAVVDQHGTGVTPDGGDGGIDTPKLIGGDIGRNVLLLSDRQMESLLEQLGIDGFTSYATRLINWVLRSGAEVDHYHTILKWWREDAQAASQGPDIIWGGNP